MSILKSLVLFTFSFLGTCLLVSCEEESSVKRKPNILLICVDDLRPELASFGKSYINSPNIDQLASEGIAFQRHFVNAPSCGPSRYTLLTGLYGPVTNNALFFRSNQIKEGIKVYPSMPEWFKAQGYTTVSVGKVSHHPGGLGGEDWNDTAIIEMPGAWDKQLMPVAEWEHPRGAMHGLAHGEIRIKPSEMDVFQSGNGGDDIYPDGVITNKALDELKLLSSHRKKPFFLAVGLIKPHLPFGAPKSYYDQYKNIELPQIEHPQKPDGQTTWHNSGEFRQYNLWEKDPNKDAAFADELRRHYAACVSYADAQVGKMLAALKESGEDKNTVVVLWGDHGWHLGEYSIWGKHSLFEEALHSPLIIRYPEMKYKGLSTDALVETLDIFPTLCDLSETKIPDFVQGKSLMKILENPKEEDGHPVIAYWKDAKTIRTLTHRMILHQDGFVELYDHTTTEKETQNVADQYTEVVKSLSKALEAKIR